MLMTCQAGFESLLARELEELHGRGVGERGPGWIRIEGNDGAPGGLSLSQIAFARLTLLAPVEVRGDSVNALAARVAEFFLATIRSERIEATWPNVWLGPQELVGLGRRISG